MSGKLLGAVMMMAGEHAANEAVTNVVEHTMVQPQI
jgi:anti-sigma regulatory factor (Ser/Thr protein kinase)